MANCADTKAVGIKKIKAPTAKKKITCAPNKAVTGKLRMLSILPVISIIRLNKLMLTALRLDEVEVADAKGKSSRWYHQGGITAPDNFLNQICTAQAP